MVISTASTTSTSDINYLTQMQDFKDGKINITKSDLTSSVQKSVSNGETVSSTMLDIIDSYDKIDTNGDGISYEELTAYKNSTAGILSSMGLSATSIKQKELSMVADVFLDDDSDDSSDDLSSLLTSNTLSVSTTQAINNYLSSLNSDTDSTLNSTESILDLLS